MGSSGEKHVAATFVLTIDVEIDSDGFLSFVPAPQPRLPRKQGNET